MESSTRFGRNKLYYNWNSSLWSLEHIIGSINNRLGEKVSSETFSNYSDHMVRLINSLGDKLFYENKKLKDILKQELKIDVDDYEYVTETKLVKKSKVKK